MTRENTNNIKLPFIRNPTIKHLHKRF